MRKVALGVLWACPLCKKGQNCCYATVYQHKHWFLFLSFHRELEWEFWFGIWLGWNTKHIHIWFLHTTRLLKHQRPKKNKKRPKKIWRPNPTKPKNFYDEHCSFVVAEKLGFQTLYLHKCEIKSVRKVALGVLWACPLCKKGQNCCYATVYQHKHRVLFLSFINSDGPIVSNKSEWSIFDFLIFYWFK